MNDLSAVLQRPLRILHVLDHSLPLHSGYTFRTRAILKAQRALGWQTFHVTGPKQGVTTQASETVDGLEFRRTTQRAHWRARLPVLGQLEMVDRLTVRLMEVAREVQPDVLHAHSPALNAMAALRVGRKLGIPVVYEIRAFWEDAAVDHGTSTPWGMRYRMTRALETWAVHRSDATTTICEGLRTELIGRGIPAAKIDVIPNAVDIADFQVRAGRDDSLARKLGLEGCTVLGFVGSFYAYEGLNLLLDAVPALRRARPELRVLLVGGGPQELALRQKAATLGLEQVVMFCGRVPHQDVASYYELIDILCYPRLKMRLTDLVTPLKPLEAMAQGRLLVASDVGGHRELIQDGRTGILFPAGDSAALASKVLALLDAPHLWAGLRQRGRGFVEDERNWSASVARYQRVYDGVLHS